MRAILAVAAILSLAGCATTAPPQRPLDATACDGTAPASAAEAFAALRRTGFVGAAVVRRGGRPIFCAAAGEARAETPFTHVMPADVGSIAKPVTAMAMVRLHEAGLLTLDDPVGRWLPELSPEQRGVTVRQMLTHTSGFGEYLEGSEDYTRLNQAELLRRAAAQPLAFRPGAQWGYSNLAYQLLGVVLERAARRSYSEVIHREVLARAGVTGSFDPASLGQVAEGRTSTGWTDLQRTAAASNGPFWGLWGAGGLYMSTDDLALLMEAFAAGRIVSSENVRLASEPAVALDEQNAGGLIWGLLRQPSGAWGFYFNGATDHSTADVRYDPRSQTSIAVVSQDPRSGAMRSARSLAAAVLGSAATAPR